MRQKTTPEPEPIDSRITPTRVINRHDICPDPDLAVYIARPSKWGNPFKVGRDGNRLQVIEKYAAYLRKRPDLLRDLHEIQGKVLVCWCRPLACHGDVLARAADEQAVRRLEKEVTK